MIDDTTTAEGLDETVDRAKAYVLARGWKHTDKPCWHSVIQIMAGFARDSRSSAEAEQAEIDDLEKMAPRCAPTPPGGGGLAELLELAATGARDYPIGSDVWTVRVSYLAEHIRASAPSPGAVTREKIAKIVRTLLVEHGLGCPPAKAINGALERRAIEALSRLQSAREGDAS